jgi:hypothetical protein
MSMHSNAISVSSVGATRINPRLFSPINDPGDDPTGPTPFDRASAGREDLPYKVEVWDENKLIVEQVLAVTSNTSIGFAAYYAATREYPGRYITLRHKNSVIARWNPPGQ